MLVYVKKFQLQATDAIGPAKSLEQRSALPEFIVPSVSAAPARGNAITGPDGAGPGAGFGESLWASEVNFTPQTPQRPGTGRATRARQCPPSKAEREPAEGPEWGEVRGLVRTFGRLQHENPESVAVARWGGPVPCGEEVAADQPGRGRRCPRRPQLEERLVDRPTSKRSFRDCRRLSKIVGDCRGSMRSARPNPPTARCTWSCPRRRASAPAEPTKQAASVDPPLNHGPSRSRCDVSPSGRQRRHGVSVPTDAWPRAKWRLRPAPARDQEPTLARQPTA